uniref:Uncharacterized protein n=1 Tax=Anguilla anguilla TaxID=7936 RepID=A0A0E9W4F3_ANGAN
MQYNGEIAVHIGDERQSVPPAMALEVHLWL